MIESMGNYAFNFIREVASSPIGAFSVGVEKRDSASYDFSNREREPMYLFQYTLSGSGTLERDGERHVIREGEGFLLRFPDASRYFFDEERNKGPWHFIYVLFEGQGTDEYYELICKRCGNILSLASDASSVRAAQSLFEAAHAGKITDSFIGERMVFDFLCKLCTDCLGMRRRYSETVYRAMRLMDTEYATAEGIADVAKRLGVTQNHLCRRFSEETDTSPIAYLTRVRLGHAANLLYRTRDSIDAIAKACGFSCGNYFCKVFRRYMGVSPLKYRNRAAGILYDEVRV